ncbi:MAG: recombinase family protein [Acidobacteriia bacterium]|nr:recombinase family protein [Terriglobia bacterium]
MALRAPRQSADHSGGVVPAAEYVRMSTDHQQYSTENQHAAIQRFADAHGITIVRSFIDAGKSGVGIQGRDALQELLRTVESGHAEFRTILVYDVSRWGRFQEPDEGAYYEYRCIRANITVQYCAEQFPTDNAPMSAVMKSLKRAMAGEYSRELSAKVFAGQCRLVTLGYRQGGAPGYGLQRQLLDQHGQPKAILARGERKSFQLERVILTPGPETEIAVIHRIYQLFTIDHQTEAQIAAILNEEGIPAEAGRPWTRGTIHEVLTNEKYIGNNLYNRTSTKLQTPRVLNKPDDWVRCNNAYQPVIDAELFARAQAIINERDHRYTDEELLQRLRDLLQQHGTLSGLIINETAGMPSTATYANRFHSLRRAYELVGYTPARDYSYLAINQALRSLHDEHVTHITKELTSTGASIHRDQKTDLLTINEAFTVALSIARCRELHNDEYRWVVRFDTSLDPDITIGARMAPGNKDILDYYLFPSIDVLSDHCRLARTNGFVLDVYHALDLTPILNLARPILLPEAA